jgi:polyhydroxybutyrate depolymerase
VTSSLRYWLWLDETKALCVAGCMVTLSSCTSESPSLSDGGSRKPESSVTHGDGGERRPANGGSGTPGEDAARSVGAGGANANGREGGPKEGGTAPTERHFDVPRGASAGCGKGPPAGDGSDSFVRHDLDVTGVDPAFVAAHPPQASLKPYDWTHRNYFLKLPAHYDENRAYPVSMGAPGCGGDKFSGNNGGLRALPNGQADAIEIGLSYVFDGGACFADDYVNTPELPYFDALLREVESRYCVDRSRVFVDGFSSGAWETYLFGCARAGVVRGIGTAEGGLRLTRPACTNVPVAAFLIAGLQDQENPIGPLATPKNDSYGSAPARDDILKRNGCTGTAQVPWDPAFPKCLRYTDCPAEYPVVWCAIDDGHGPGNPPGGPNYSGQGFWKFWSLLPDAP